MRAHPTSLRHEGPAGDFGTIETLRWSSSFSARFSKRLPKQDRAAKLSVHISDSEVINGTHTEPED